ncbi:MAG TPA: ATP-dependent Clp protease proteolytic subunit [Symbiobacteriaceae bacterium]|nr:ATP-dependent Clp protease proteolytic subunit [Symbiobacteriaceae bacterium]
MQKLQDLLWLWMILGFTVLPAVKTALQTMRRKQILAKLERERGSKVITMIHRQQPGILGALMARYINLDDSEQMMQTIARAGDKPIDLVLHTPGGLVIAAEQIARVLKAHKAGVTVIVPQFAMSGGTLLAMAADQIIMDRHAMLGPVDPQLGGMPASAYMRVLKEKDRNAVQDDTLMMADMAEKATNQLRDMAFGLLKDKMGEARATEVATMMTEGRWTHDFPLHAEQLQEMGFPVSTAIPQEFWELLGLSNAAQNKILRTADPKKAPAKM